MKESKIPHCHCLGYLLSVFYGIDIISINRVGVKLSIASTSVGETLEPHFLPHSSMHGYCRPHQSKPTARLCLQNQEGGCPLGVEPPHSLAELSPWLSSLTFKTRTNPQNPLKKTPEKKTKKFLYHFLKISSPRLLKCFKIDEGR